MMKRFIRLALLGCAVAITLAAFAPSALAAAAYTLFGDAVLVSPGNASPTAVKLTSLCPGGSGICFGNGTFTYSGVDFAIPAAMTFADLSTLATDYKFILGGCGGGSPRFQVNLTNGIVSGNVFVYIGPPPNYNPCPLGAWQNTGNLAAPTNLVDTSQLPGGIFYDPYATAQTQYGTYQVTGIQLVADGGWAVAGNNQTVHVDNVTINDATYTFENPESCKKGGWQQFTAAPGPFKNQGQCVSYFEHQK